MSTRKRKPTWSRKKIHDKFTGMLTKDNKPMSRQQIFMLRQKQRKKCLCCGSPSVGVYCLKHQVHVRERAREKFGYERRLTDSMSYRIQAQLRAR